MWLIQEYSGEVRHPVGSGKIRRQPGGGDMVWFHISHFLFRSYSDFHSLSEAQVFLGYMRGKAIESHIPPYSSISFFLTLYPVSPILMVQSWQSKILVELGVLSRVNTKPILEAMFLQRE